MSERWRVRRDRWGIPHCWGATPEDLAHAQGWSAAVDRAWQLETERRRSRATAAAVLGSSDWDDFATATGLPQMARAAVADLDEETQAWLLAFVDGVNEGIDEGASRAPEFAATDIEPERWEPWDPAGVFLVQHVLMGPFGHQLWRRHVRATLGDDGLDLVGHEGVPLGGSNAWALTGSRTASGRPMIAADPHRVLEAPGIYQQVRLSTPSLDVRGLAFPGVPGVPHFGHTGSVAWAVTHAMADYQQIAPDSDATIPHPLTPAGVDGDIGLATMRRLLHARTVDDVDWALEDWIEPVNCVLIAGADGRVRERVAGRMVTKGGATVPVPPARRDLTEGEVVVHANDRRDSVADLGEEFAPPHRGARIAELLTERERWDAASLARIQMDTRLGSWPTFASLLLRVEANGPGAEVRRRLLDWDGRMDADSTEAALFARWRTELVSLVAAHPRLAALHSPTGLATLFAPWTDPVARIGAGIERVVAHGERHGLPVPDLATTALARVADTLDEGTWGESHFAPFVRVLVGDDGPGPRPLGGDGDCVLATSAVPGLSDQCWRGPAARLVWDLGGPSGWVVPLGADGPTHSPHAHDQLDAWLDNRLIPITAPRGACCGSSSGSGPAPKETLVTNLTFRPLRPADDAPLIHDWARMPRGRFWGMADKSVAQIRDIYDFVDSLEAHWAWIAEDEGRPVALLQTYLPEHDPISEVYDVQPGDLGAHAFIAPGEDALSVGSQVFAWAFADPAVQRLVGEPDASNRAILVRLEQSGFELGERVRIGDKDARLVHLTRERFEALVRAAG